MTELKDKLELIIEQSSCVKPACKNCKSYLDGACTFGCVNERNGVGGYKLNNNRMTSPTYSCKNFDATYKFGEDTLDVMRDVIEDIDRVCEAKKNLELLLNGKITESDFIDMVK